MPFFTAEQAMHLKHQSIGFTINNRPAPSYVFLHFINPICIYLNGQEIHTSSNACVIFTPGSNLHYTAKKIQMLHNFLHFNVEDAKIFQELRLPLNTVFYTNLQNDITHTIEYIETCTVKKFDKYEQQIDERIAKLFKMISEEQCRRINLIGFSVQSRFDDLRTLIYQNPKNWSVEAMAQYVNLSRSRFSIKYREIFNVTPNRDLIDASLLYANKLLSTTDIKISDLAYECGFTSPDYFIRLYRKHYGLTPGAYRKKIRASNDRNVK